MKGCRKNLKCLFNPNNKETLMKKLAILISLVTLIMGLVVSAFASGSQADAKVLVEKAVTFLKSNGKEKALTEFSKSKGTFDKGDLYVFAYDMNATIVAHPKNAKLIGKNLLEVPDTDGKLFRKEIVEVAKNKGSGWVDYKYMNPETKKVENKTTYVLRVEDTIVCCGAYK
jgi:signal transduction histidine kinase